MIIEGSALSLSARHLASETNTSRSSMQAWVDGSAGGGRGGLSLSSSKQSASMDRSVTVEVSAAAQLLNAADARTRIVAGAGAGGASATELGTRSAPSRLPSRSSQSPDELFAALDGPSRDAVRAVLRDLDALRSGKGLPGAFVRRGAGAGPNGAGAGGPKLALVGGDLAAAGRAAAGLDPSLEDDPASADPKLQALIQLIERLTGRKVRLMKASDLEGCEADRRAMEDVARAAGAAGAARGGGPAGQAQQRQGWGVAVDVHAEHHEAEVTQVAVSGTVVTGDGRRIDVALDVTMARSLAQVVDERIRMGDAKLTDPLVIDLGPARAAAAAASVAAGSAGQAGSAAPADPNAIVGLAQATFAFDLDSDGVKEQIHTLAPDSGFLVMDWNRNGVVDDGSELLGPASGAGFSELAALDGDGNGWIDERDASFSLLQVWTPGAGGDQSALLGLKAAGVGAIATVNVASPFLAKDASGDVRGQVVSTGLYLSEAGVAGAVHQVDLAG